MAKDARKESLSDGVGFATLKNTFPEASAELVENVRATLRHAQEITASVGEAEAAIERAQSTVAMVDASQTAIERKIVSDEIEKVTRWLNKPKEETWFEKYLSRSERPGFNERTASVGNDKSSTQTSGAGAPSQPTSPTVTQASADAAKQAQSGGGISGPAVAASDDTSVNTTAQAGGQSMVAGAAVGGNAAGEAAVALSPIPGAAAGGAFAASGGAGAAGKISDVSADMAEQIETTVMWVQQLLESVHFAGSEQGLEPGASLLSIVQPGRRIQKDVALTQSVHLFHEKKEEEEDAEDDAPAFRSRALQAVQALQAGGSTPS